MLKALILAGGESRRMGADKALARYHGAPQFEYLFDLIHPLVDAVFISVHPDRILKTSLPVLVDKFFDAGPYGAIMTAFDLDPHCAWITVPCDMPDFDRFLLAELIYGRNTEMLATCFQDPSTEMPEPLLALWESKSYPVLKKYYSDHGSLRRLLSTEAVNILQPLYPHKLMDVDTKEEQDKWRQRKS